jgi:hypothetical protein
MPTLIEGFSTAGDRFHSCCYCLYSVEDDGLRVLR